MIEQAAWRTKPCIEIAGRRIGAKERVFIIAEAGCNHNGDTDLAKRLIDVAAESGADAVKFQTFRAESLATEHAPKADYALETTDPGESQLEMQKKLELSPDQHEELIAYCRNREILFLSSAFDIESADLLESLRVSAFKIPSGEIVNHPLLEHIARKGKPIILSTGMSYLGEVEEAVHIIQGAGNPELALLHCTSNYPARAEDVNLRAMTTVATAFDLPVGYSDHTPGIEVSIAAVTMGACIIEKHFTLDRSLPGPDHQASLEPHELVELVRTIRNVETALGDGIKRPMLSEENTRQIARKSIVARCGIPRGTILTSDMVTAKRPGTGILPSQLRYVLGRSTNRDIAADEMITWEMLQ